MQEPIPSQHMESTLQTESQRRSEAYLQQIKVIDNLEDLDRLYSKVIKDKQIDIDDYMPIETAIQNRETELKAAESARLTEEAIQEINETQDEASATKVYSRIVVLGTEISS